MKKHIIYLLVMLLGVFSFTSCDQTDDEPMVGTFIPPEITIPSSGTSYTLLKDAGDNLIEVIKWNAADFGFQSAVSYTVEIDGIQGDFSEPHELGTVNDTEFRIKVSQLNTAAIEYIEPGETGDIQIRVKAVVHDDVEVLYSEPVLVTVSTFQTSVPPIYMIGAAVGGWDTALAVEVPATEEDDVYQTKAYFEAETGGNFRFFSAPDWGASLGGYDVFTDYPADLLEARTSDSDPNFGFIGTTGWYEITVNTASGSISMEAIDEPNLYLTGDATHGWNWNEPVTSISWVGHEIWEGNVTFIQNNYFRLFEQKDWGPVSYGYDLITNYDTDYIIIAEGHSDPNWQFVAASGEYFVRVDKRNATIEISPVNE